MSTIGEHAMILKYHNTIEDVVAFNRFHCAHSSTVRRTKLTCMVAVAVLLIAGAFVIPPTPGFSREILIGAAVVIAALFSVTFHYTFSSSLGKQVRRFYSEGMNPGLFGQHELEISPDGLIERTDTNENRQSWRAVERIVETKDYVFIYTGAVMAHVVPKKAVSFGNLDAFLPQAKQWWLAANPSAENPVPAIRAS